MEPLGRFLEYSMESLESILKAPLGQTLGQKPSGPAAPRVFGLGSGLGGPSILNSLVLNTMKKTIFCFENGNKRTKMPSSAVRSPSWSMTFLPAIRLECHGCCTALSLVASKICHSIWNCQVYRSNKRMWGFTSHIISVYGVLYPLNSSTASEELWSHCTI